MLHHDNLSYYLFYPLYLSLARERALSLSLSYSFPPSLPLSLSLYIYIIMVFILDGCSFHVAHVWCKQGLFPKKNWIWWLFRCNQMPSTNRKAWFTPCVRIVKWATIYYQNHGSPALRSTRTNSHVGAKQLTKIGKRYTGRKKVYNIIQQQIKNTKSFR